MPASRIRPPDQRRRGSGAARPPVVEAVVRWAAAGLDRWKRLAPKWRAAIAAALAAVVAAGVWLALPTPSDEPRARQYLAFKACLLTDSHGIAGKEAAPVWEGMRRASLKTHAKIQYLAVPDPATVANARPYLASLVQRQCGVIIAAGELATDTVTANARNFATAHFVVLGTAGAAENVRAVRVSGTPVAAAVERVVSEAVT
ncbi:BMP family ABC transporter substrate-binding protein [Actinomadura bangladeshensis]|uniref:BMP family ABC transporter substrate-binding protein n=1 Tax=Actinomadura bangladeshensis TaxID=453573 RepID=UPI0014045AC8|nr:BMP family ABC transporter substrate-binding protein [Actinomadura bangladeshensis]